MYLLFRFHDFLWINTTCCESGGGEGRTGSEDSSCFPAPSTKTQPLLPETNMGKKAKVGLNAEKQSGRKSRSAKSPGTDVPSIYLIVQSTAFSRDPLVMTTPLMTSLPEKMKLCGARKPSISKH